MRFIRQTISSFIKLSLLLLVLGWGSSAYSAELISPADNATVTLRPTHLHGALAELIQQTMAFVRQFIVILTHQRGTENQ